MAELFPDAGATIGDVLRKTREEKQRAEKIEAQVATDAGEPPPMPAADLSIGAALRRAREDKQRQEEIDRRLRSEQNSKIDAEAQAKALPIARDAGIPIDTARRNLDQFEVERQQREVEKARADAPSYGKLLDTEDHGPIAQSAISDMPYIERTVRGLGQAFVGGFDDDERLLIGSKIMEGTATPVDESRLAEIEAVQKQRTDFNLGTTGEVFQSVAGSIPGMGYSLLGAADEALIGGGAAVALALPGSVGPQAAGTIPSAFLLGAGWGGRYGYLKESYKRLSGGAFLEARGVRDANGNPLDAETVYGVAATAGTISAIAEMIPMEKALDNVPMLKGLAGKEGAKWLAEQAATNPAMRTWFARVGRIAKTGGAEAFAELVQEVATLESIIAAGGVTDEAGNALADQRGDRYTMAVLAGGVGGMLFGTAGETVTAVEQRITDMRIKRAEAKQQSLIDLGDRIRNSKVNGISPETIVAHAKQMDADGAAPAMSAPAEKLVELFQSEGLTAEQVQVQFPEVAKALDEAAQTGAEVTLNAEGIAKLARLEGFASITEDIRTGPDELTVREARERSQELDDFVATVSEEDKRAAVRASIENQVTQQLVASGQEPRAAATMARVHASAITTMAERSGMTPDQVMQRFKLDITGNQQTDMAAADPNATMYQRAKDAGYGEPAIRVGERVFKASDYFPNWERGSRPEAGRGLMSIADEQALEDVDLGPGMPEDPFWGHAELVRAAREQLGSGVVDQALDAAVGYGVGFVNADGDFRNVEEINTGNRGTFDPNDPNILYQSGNPLFAAPLPIEGKVTVRAIGEAFNKDHLDKFGRQLFPENSAEDYATVLQFAKGELDAQLKEKNSGVGWYSKDVQLAIELASRVYPTLTSNPLHRDLYLTFAGLFSNGSDPDQAFMMSAEAFETFLATGEIPVNRADGARARGVEPKMTTFDDRKTGKKVTKEAGWGIRNQANEQQLAFVKQIVEWEGSVEAGLRWMMTTHPRAEINKAMTERGLYKAGRYTTKVEVAGPDAQGLMAFGEKLGRYTMGLHGVDIDAGDTTIDLWFTRTYRRWTGRLLETPLGKEGVAAQPTDTDRRVIFSLVGDLAKEYDLPPGDVQAVLWFFEKRLWGSQGLRTNEGTNSSGARKLLRSKGLDDGEGGDGADLGAGQEDQGSGDAEGGVTLNQTAQTTQTLARGSIAISPGRDKFVITLTGKADLSTFMHEAGHYYLEVLQGLVESGDANRQMVDDLSNIRTWMGLDPTQKIDRKHHEKFARGWEAYLMEGRAPSAELQGAFNRFRAWLVFIYKRMTALNVDLNDDIRGVMDRLIASDAEIAEARTNIGWAKPLPKEALFLNDDEYDRYVESWNKANEAQQRELDAKLMLEAARETQAAWKEERRQVFEEEKAKLAQTRGYRHWKLLSTGEGLDTDAPGRTSLKIDPASVPAEWSRDAAGMTDEMGLPLDAVAEILGYDSGEQMLSLIAGARMAERDLPRQVKQIMAERHGDLDMTALADIASSAVHSDQTQEVLLTEFRAMAAKAGTPNVPPGLTKWMAAQAQQRVLGLTRRQLDPMRWRRAELKAAQQAAKAKDPTQAAIFKRQQMMAAAMYKATIDADKRVDVIRRKLMPFTKNDRRAKLGKAGDVYLDGIDQILEDIQLKPMSAKSVQKLDRLAALVAEADANGEPLVLPDKLRAMLGKKNFQDMTLEELEGVHDTVMNIWHLAKLKNELKARNEKRQLEEAITEMEANAAAALGDPKIKDKFVYGWKDRAASRMREFRAGLVKMEFLFGWLDGKPDGGLMHRLIYQPIADANRAKFKIMKRFHKSIIQHMRNLPADQKARWNAKRTFLGREANGATIISAAMNLGNEGNKSKLLKGYGLNTPQGEQQLMAEINAFMTKADWDFVQHVWTEIDTLWPEIAKTTKAATGLEPEKVVPTPVTTPFGTYAGGYYPVVYDPTPRPGVDAKNTLKQFERQQSGEGLFSANYMSPTLGDGFTKARVDFENPPILLDLRVISQHLSEVVHYVTHYEAITQADKITRHPRFIKLVQGTMGDEFYKTIRPWLIDVARDQDTPAVTKTEPYAKAMRYLRGGMSIGAMGYNVFTGFKQLLGVTTSLDAVKARYLLSGLQKAWASPNVIQNWKTAFEQSGELEALVTQFDRDIKMINDTYAKQGIRSRFDKFNAMAFAHIGWLQAAVNVATWYGAKEQAIAEGMTEQAAIDRADAVVRKTQSAGAVKDLSPIQRGSEINRNVSMFYSWFNVLYNRMEDIQKQTKGVRDLPKAAKRVAILIMMTALVEETASRAYEAIVDNVDDDDEEAGFILTVLMKSADTALGAIPLVRAFISAEAAAGGLKPEISPVVRVGADYWRTFEAIKDLVVEQEAPSRSEVKTAARTVAVLTHVPVSGVWNLIDEYFGEEIFGERRKNR